MKLRWALFPGAILAVFLLVSPRSEAVNQNAINAVRVKQVLDQSDLAVIDTFLSEAIDELVKTRDFATIAQIRSIILSKQGGQGRYAKQFSESARKHIATGLEKAQILPEERRNKVLVNLLILIDRLGDLQLANLSLNNISNDMSIVRYWVVKSLANPAIVAQMQAEGDNGLRLAGVIADRFKAVVGTSRPEVLALMADFAGQIRIAQADLMLIEVADARIKDYNAWTVKYELVDSSILKALADRIAGSGTNKNAVAWRFGQLLSCVMQRYIKGADRLTQTQKGQLASVLAEVETKSFAKLLGGSQGAIRRAIDNQDYTALQTEYDNIFGRGNTPGQLVTRLEFNFGTDPAGRDKTSPTPLPDPPAPKPTSN